MLFMNAEDDPICPVDLLTYPRELAGNDTGHDAINPFLQQRYRPAFTTMQSDQHLCYSLAVQCDS